MGQEIQKTTFTDLDHEEFSKKLKEETEILKSWFDKKAFMGKSDNCGLELEGWILNKDGSPAAENQNLIPRVNDSLIVPEISKFNFEFNSVPQKMEGKFLFALEENLQEVWGKCERVASDMNLEVSAIGILPTVRDEHLVIENMSAMTRYHALNIECLKQRSHKPFEIEIKGEDSLRLTKKDVMMEAAATSLQIHLQTTQEEAADLYNLSLILSAPMVAICANSPTLYEKILWHETRVPLFEQSVQLPAFIANDGSMIERVSFGNGYISSLFELFEENLKYPILLPYICNDKDANKLNHVRLHNGNIWRWNRPIIGGEDGAEPHLRIEHRVNSAGPSHKDVVANTALYLGMSKALLSDCKNLCREISFSQAKENFYLAARDGLDAVISWRGSKVPIKEVLLQELIPAGRAALQKMGTDVGSLTTYFDQILTPRTETGINGAAWQLKILKENGNDYQKLMKAYLQAQKSLKPVHLW